MQPYAKAALGNDKKLVYFHFARHEPLLHAQNGVNTHELKPQEGFENFLAAVVGQSQFVTLGEIIYVVPELYAQLPLQDRRGIARLFR